MVVVYLLSGRPQLTTLDSNSWLDLAVDALGVVFIAWFVRQVADSFPYVEAVGVAPCWRDYFGSIALRVEEGRRQGALLTRHGCRVKGGQAGFCLPGEAHP